MRDDHPDTLFSHRIRIAPDVTVSRADGAFQMQTTLRRVQITTTLPGSVLDALSDWIVVADFFSAAMATLGTSAGAAATELLQACRDAGALEEAIFDLSGPVLCVRVIPGTGLGPDTRARPGTSKSTSYTWQQGVSLTPVADGWEISSPMSAGIACIAAPHIPNIPARGWRPEGPLATAIAKMLAQAQLLVDQDGKPDVPALDPTSLRLHAQSRRGSARAPVGATGTGTVPELPDVCASTVRPLPVPPRAPQNGFDEVLFARRSLRPTTDGLDPHLSAERIASLLWSAARDLGPARSDRRNDARRARPYPSPGGLHALTLTLAFADPPAGVPRLGRYDPASHGLVPLQHPPDALLTDAGAAMGTEPPPGVILVSACFAPVARRYGDAAYALILKETGALVQTLHLTATALGLGSCILGGGNSRAFASATKLDPCHEGPVGEIALTGTIRSIQTTGELP